MPDSDRIPEELILAAVRRAQLHQDREGGAALPTIKAHLGLRHNGWTTQQLRPHVDALVAAGQLAHLWRRSKDEWAITPPGRRRASPFRALPESPQHQAWRHARTLAEQEHERIWTAALDAVEDAEELVSHPPEPRPPSAAWVAMGERLQIACYRMASVTHCLREWREPDDRRADVPPPGTRGLRNTRKWGED